VSPQSSIPTIPFHSYFCGNFKNLPECILLRGNSFAMDDAGVLNTYTLTPPYTWTSAANVTAFFNRPSRFMVEAFGVVGPNVPPPPTCAADLNLDGVVNGADLGLMLGSWGNCPV
jgi:hypothetical protein